MTEEELIKELANLTGIFPESLRYFVHRNRKIQKKETAIINHKKETR